MEKEKTNKEVPPKMRDFFFQVVVKFRDEQSLFDLRNGHDIDFGLLDSVIPWRQFRNSIPDIKVHRLFTSLSTDEINTLVERARSLDSNYRPPNFFFYYVIGVPTEMDARTVWQALAENKNVEWTYIVNDSTPPNALPIEVDSVDIAREHLGRAPYGINAEYAWGFKGGDGEGQVKFIDIEQGWILDHESIQVSTLPTTGFNHVFHDHGAAALGVVMMTKNDNTKRGIVPKVNGYVVSQWRPAGFLNNADAIMAALRHLEFGDVILLQAQVRDLSIAKKLWPVEAHRANFDALRLAAALGIIVVEPAANGSMYFNFSNDLDYLVQDGRRILNRTDANFRDSGAIVVAGASTSAPHKKIPNSNYGSRVDCYAWGENVFSAGNFPNSSNGAIDRYTTQFSGTSSAAAIIAGVVIALQSIMEANLNFRLGPVEMRRILSCELYGTPSGNGHSIDKIGVMPDLKKIINNTVFLSAT